MLTMIQLVGAPYSVGDAPGQGVRLIFGTDFTVNKTRLEALNAT